MIPQHLSGMTEENYKRLTEDNRSPGQDSSLGPPKYEAGLGSECLIIHLSLFAIFLHHLILYDVSSWNSVVKYETINVYNRAAVGKMRSACGFRDIYNWAITWFGNYPIPEGNNSLLLKKTNIQTLSKHTRKQWWKRNETKIVQMQAYHIKIALFRKGILLGCSNHMIYNK